MSSIAKLRTQLTKQNLSPEVVARIFEGFEEITDKSTKARRVAFFRHATRVMDETLDFRTRCDLRGPCACCTGGWREKAARRVAREGEGKSLAERVRALGEVRYMGDPTLNEDGTISGGVGTEGGFDCPCTVFTDWKYEEPVSSTYCLCCAGHFLHHYQIALGVKLRVKAVLSTALESQRAKPCRFVYELE